MRNRLIASRAFAAHHYFASASVQGIVPSRLREAFSIRKYASRAYDWFSTGVVCLESDIEEGMVSVWYWEDFQFKF